MEKKAKTDIYVYEICRWINWASLKNIDKYGALWFSEIFAATSSEAAPRGLFSPFIKIQQKFIKLDPKTDTSAKVDFGWPKWHQNWSKMEPKGIQHLRKIASKIRFFLAYLSPFWLFAVLFTGLNNAVEYQKWQISGMLHQWQQYKLKTFFQERENKESHLTLNGCNPRPNHQ